MLGIFNQTKSEENKSKQHIELKMWNKCKERDMKILSSSAPKNLLEEMAIKTDQGILWEFPINNEQGIDQDKVSYQLANCPDNSRNLLFTLSRILLNFLYFRSSPFTHTFFSTIIWKNGVPKKDLLGTLWN